MFEGCWVNDNLEGYVKFISDNGEFYIGQFKVGLRHGKGTDYYSNGNIKLKGKYINSEFVEN